MYSYHLGQPSGSPSQLLPHPPTTPFPHLYLEHTYKHSSKAVPSPHCILPLAEVVQLDHCNATLVIFLPPYWMLELTPPKDLAGIHLQETSDLPLWSVVQQLDQKYFHIQMNI